MRHVKSLFTNIQKQRNMLKISLLFTNVYKLYEQITREFPGLRTRNFQCTFMISLVVLFCASGYSLGTDFDVIGHNFDWSTQLDPLVHNFWILFPLHPRLPILAGFCWAGTYLHSMLFFFLIFKTLLVTNSSYACLVFNQNKTIVLSV